MKSIDPFEQLAHFWGRHGLDLLFPPRCSVCGEDLQRDYSSSQWSDVCQRCERLLSADVPRCMVCGEVCFETVDGCRQCTDCRPPWQGLIALSGYGLHTRDAVLRAKHPGGEVIAAAMGRLLAEKHRALIDSWKVECVVPVPMHFVRRAFRGTNPAEEIARGFSKTMGFLWSRALARVQSTRMQNELPFSKRAANVRNAFQIRARVRGKRMLLIDDVCTTGSTLKACSGVLLRAGAEKVFCAVVSKADRSA